MAIHRLASGAYAITITLPEGLRAPETDTQAAEPKWNMLFPGGKTKYRADFPSGLTFGASTFDAMVTNFRKAKARYLDAAGFGLPITYSHVGPSTPDNPRPIEERVAAGWIEDLAIRDGDLWGLTRWTPEGKSRVRRDEFRFLSPEFGMDFLDPDTGRPQGPTLFGAALLNDPFLYEMPRVAASSSHQGRKAKHGEKRMDKSKLCEMLGLSPETPDDEVEKALSARLSAAASTAELEKAKVEMARASTEAKALGEQLKTLSAAHQGAAAELAALRAKEAAASVVALCQSLVREGKVLPAQVDTLKELCAKLGTDYVAKLYASMPAIVKLGSAGVDVDPANADGGLEYDEGRRRFFAEVDKFRSQGLDTAKATLAARAAHPKLALVAFSPPPGTSAERRS